MSQQKNKGQNPNLTGTINPDDKEQIRMLEEKYQELIKLGDQELIMLTLAELVSVAYHIPQGGRLPLYAALKARSNCDV